MPRKPLSSAESVCRLAIQQAVEDPGNTARVALHPLVEVCHRRLGQKQSRTQRTQVSNLAGYGHSEGLPRHRGRGPVVAAPRLMGDSLEGSARRALAVTHQLIRPIGRGDGKFAVSGRGAGLGSVVRGLWRSGRRRCAHFHGVQLRRGLLFRQSPTSWCLPQGG